MFSHTENALLREAIIKIKVTFVISLPYKTCFGKSKQAIVISL